MIDKESLMKELKQQFDLTKKDLGFKSNFEDLEEIFFLKDAVLSVGFVSDKYSRQLCSRIVDTYMSWISYLHGTVFPQPGNMIAMTENKIFNDTDKKEILDLMKKTLALLTDNNVIKVTRDKKAEAKFIDDSLLFWKKTFEPKLKEILVKSNKGWKE